MGRTSSAGCAYHLICFFLAVFSICVPNALAIEYVAGDVAPRFNQDSLLTGDDITLVQKFISGELTPTAAEKKLADVYPAGTGDGLIDANDLDQLNKALSGQVALAKIQLAAPPILNDPGFINTVINPISLSGSASPNATVQAYVNGVLQESSVAAADGTFNINTPLYDGSNQIFIVALSGASVSANSNTVNISYQNTASRALGGSIAGTVVLTPGVPAQPYTVTGSDLVIPSGARLILQPGTEIQFSSARKLTVNGTLLVKGTALSGVRLVSNGGSPVRGAWGGITINSTSINTLIENAVIESATQGLLVNAANVQIKNNTLRYFTSDGIKLSGAGSSSSLVQNNLVDNLNDTGSCLTAENSSATFSGNTATNCNYGVNIISNSSPVINNNNIITGNIYGIRFYTSALTTLPLINGNQIFANTTNSILATGFPTGAQNLKINATGNWWGTTNPAAIATSISDLSDNYASTALPTIDYSNFLDGAGGNPVPGNYLSGQLTATSTILTAGATYDVLGVTFVPTGKSLTIPAGTTLRFHTPNYLTVDGTLTIQGAANNKVTLTSGQAVPARDDWRGIWIRSGTNSIIENVNIEYVKYGVYLDVAGQVKHTTIRYFSTDGIHVTGTGSSASLIQGNQIDNLNDTGGCLVAENSSPAFVGNTAINCNYGVNIIGNSSPVINNNNIITNNIYGVNFSGGLLTTLPTITGNQIFSNSSYNLYAVSFAAGAQNIKINATNNWWGTTSPSLIAASISDLSDNQTSTTLPTVDYSSFLDGAGGNPVAGNYLIGQLSATSTTLTAGATYDVLGVTFVPTGKSLIIPAGTTLRFHTSNYLTVDGTLTIQGTANNKVILTSGKPTPARDDWRGIWIRSGTNSIIENANIEYVRYGVYLDVAGQVKNSTIRYFSYDGIHVTGTGSSASLIQGNQIDNLNDTANCLTAENSSPAFVGNSAINCNYGVNIIGNASPVINGNNIITNNIYGVSFTGGVLTTLPAITGNQIFSNSSYNLYVVSFATGAQNIKINATGNWWGTTNPSAIAASISDLSDNYASTTLPTMDYSNFLDGVGGNPVTGNYLIGQLNATSTTLTAGATYDVLGVTFVPTGKSLTVPAGTTLRFHTPNYLTVDGTLAIQGTVNNKVTLTSGRPTPARDDWSGIWIRSGANSVIENTNIEYVKYGVYLNVSGQVKNNTIRYFSTDGIRVTGAGSNASLIQGNQIDNLNDTASCLTAENSSPTFAGNTAINCNYGVQIIGNASPVINGNNILTNNNYGIRFYTSALTTLPVINGNQIFANTTNNIIATGFPTGAQNIKINATGNWWGFISPSSIATSISDLSDSQTSTSLPIIDYSNFLDGANGNPVPGNYLIGQLSATSTTLTAGATYDVLGVIFVPTGKSLTIPAGTILRFHTPNYLTVDGTLAIQGTSNNKVRLTSGRPSTSNGDWAGIVLRSTGDSVIENAIIEYAKYGVYIDGIPAQIKNNLIRNFTNDGIYIKNIGANASIIQGNTVDNVNDTGNCITVDTTSPTLSANILINCSSGLNISGNSSPAVNGNNIITDNLYGVNFTSGSLTTLPVITGNQIFNNSSYNVYAVSFATGAQNLKINLTGNWWGTADPSAIPVSIYDLIDAPTSTTRPIIDFEGFLGAANGTAVAGNYLNGPLSATNTTLTAGAIYDILGPTYVQAGKSLTIPAGTVLRFNPGAKLVVSGSLSVSGASNNEVIFTSAKVIPAVSDWGGIQINSDATSVNIQNAVVQYATNGIYIDRTAIPVNVSNSLFQFNNNGIYINGNTRPVISSSRMVSNTGYGVYIYGSNNDALDPKPAINNSDFYNNTNGNIIYTNYTASPSVKINITNNWWGTTTPVFSGNALNYVPILTAISLPSSIKTHSIVNSYFSPNADSLQDSANLSATMNEATAWTIDIKNPSTGTVVRTLSGSGSSILVNWDGKDSGGTTVADNKYIYSGRSTVNGRSGIFLYREVVLDNTPPVASLDALLALQTQMNILNVPVVGTAKDRNFLNYSIDYNLSTAPMIWSSLVTNIINSIENFSLANWVVGTTIGEPVIPNGQHQLRLTVKDLAGNLSTVTSPITIDNFSISSVSIIRNVNIRENQSASVSFIASKAGLATVKIYDVSTGVGGTPVRTLTLNTAIGNNAVNWDGRDQQGINVPGSAYIFVIEGSDGSRYGLYNPTDLSISTQANFSTPGLTCDPYRNVFMAYNITAPQPGLAAVQLTTATNNIIYPFGINGAPLKAGTTTLYWDCRDPATGNLADFPVTPAYAFKRFPPNTIFIDGLETVPKIVGSGSNVEVKSNPYLIYLSYGQFTKIMYSLNLFNSQSAQVDIKLLPPLVLNFDDPTAILVYSGVQTAGDHEATWQGNISGDQSAKRTIANVEGAYTFAIKVTANGATSIYRGTLSVYQ